MPRPSAAATRDRLLRAAAAEILAEGYPGATLSSIAARLGMTKGSLAYHFPSKIDVAHAVFDHLEDAYERVRVGVRDSDVRGVRALVLSLVRTGMLTRTDIVFAAGTALLTTPWTGGVTGPPVVSELVDTYAEYLSEAVDDGEVPADVDVVEAAEDIIAAGLGKFILLSRHPERQGPKPLGITRRQLSALGVADCDRLVDDVLAAEAAVPTRFGEPPAFEDAVPEPSLDRQ